MNAPDSSPIIDSVPSSAMIVLSSRTMRLAPPAALVSSSPRRSVAAATAASIPTELFDSGRPAAATTSRSLVRLWSSLMIAPAVRAVPGPLSINWMDETANTFPGTTRAVTAAGMPGVNCGSRLICTTLGVPSMDGLTSST